LRLSLRFVRGDAFRPGFSLRALVVERPARIWKPSTVPDRSGVFADLHGGPSLAATEA
jgi:hypothetical protein